MCMGALGVGSICHVACIRVREQLPFFPSSSTMWVPGIKLGPPGLVASAFIGWVIFLWFNIFTFNYQIFIMGLNKCISELRRLQEKRKPCWIWQFSLKAIQMIASSRNWFFSILLKRKWSGGHADPCLFWTRTRWAFKGMRLQQGSDVLLWFWRVWILSFEAL